MQEGSTDEALMEDSPAEEIFSGASADSLIPPHVPTALDAAAARIGTLSPWYHTAGVVLLLLAYAFLAHFTHRAAAVSNPASQGATASQMQQQLEDTARALANTPKVPLYASTIMLSWMLLASVVAGLYHRRTFFLTSLRRCFRSSWTDPAIGLAIYLSFLSAVAIFVFVLTTVLTVRTHTAPAATAIPSAQSPSTKTNRSNSQIADRSDRSATGIPTQETQAIRDRVQHMLHFNQGAVAALAPRTLPELLLWIILSFTAAFCEEHIFRGFLLAQALALMRRLALPSWLAAMLSVLATSLLFGSLHLYEGVGGAVLIALLGAIFATIALVFGNLRAVIVAHFLQDFLGGLTYYIAHLRHAL